MSPPGRTLSLVCLMVSSLACSSEAEEPAQCDLGPQRPFFWLSQDADIGFETHSLSGVATASSTVSTRGDMIRVNFDSGERVDVGFSPGLRPALPVDARVTAEIVYARFGFETEVAFSLRRGSELVVAIWHGRGRFLPVVEGLTLEYEPEQCSFAPFSECFEARTQTLAVQGRGGVRRVQAGNTSLIDGFKVVNGDSYVSVSAGRVCADVWESKITGYIVPE